MTNSGSDAPFSLTRGGPFYGLLRRARLVDPAGNVRVLRMIAIAWLPIFVLGLWRYFVAGLPDAILFDASVHTRILVGLPLVLFAERALEQRCMGCVQRLRAEGIAEHASLNAITTHVERLRDARFPEAVIAGVAVLGAQALLWGVTDPTPLISGGSSYETTISLANLWHDGIAWPFVQFLTARWLWRWLLWTYLLVRLSRLPLELNALHPDESAGIKYLSTPIHAFAVFVASVSSVASSTWTMKVLEHTGTTIQTFGPTVVIFTVACIFVACGPLLLFSPRLYAVRLRDVGAFHTLAHEYVHEFRRKWITERPGETVLGTSDLQSLNDLGGSFKTAEETRIVPLSTKMVIVVVAAIVVPMLPLLLTLVPFTEVTRHLGKALLGPLAP